MPKFAHPLHCLSINFFSCLIAFPLQTTEESLVPNYTTAITSRAYFLPSNFLAKIPNTSHKYLSHVNSYILPRRSLHYNHCYPHPVFYSYLPVSISIVLQKNKPRGTCRTRRLILKIRIKCLVLANQYRVKVI